ncbi:MAG: hypothetical protein MUD03_03580 [Pirellula sp.]|jgi:predicted HicB family RNase H-like nuclease|nr:hypothetical protein [Pirellula sp.]
MNFEGNAPLRWTVTEGQPAAQNAPLAPAAASSTAMPPTPESGASSKKQADEAGEKLAAEMKEFDRVACELLAELNCDATYEQRVEHVMKTAADLFGLAPTWTAFYRAVLGGEGVMRKAIAAGEESAQFECSDEHSKLLTMLTTLRSRDLPENDPFEPQRMITVRIPKSLHDAICDEANVLAVSVNKLCISRLLQRVDKTMIPSSSQKRRGRRPGSAGSKNSASEPEAAYIAGTITTVESNDSAPVARERFDNMDAAFE